MIFNLLIILLFISYGLIYSKNKSRSRGIYVAVVIIAMILIAGLRHFTVGVDCKTYVSWFYDSVGKGYFHCFDTIESFYYVFQTFIANQFRDYTVFFFAIAIIVYSIIGYIIYKYSKNPLTSFLMLLGMGYYFFTMTGLRQTLGLAFLLIALMLILQRKFLLSILFVLIASQFHITSLVFFAIYPTLLIKPNKIRYFIIGICVFSILMVSFHGPIIKFFVSLVWNGNKYTEEDAIGGLTTLLVLIVIGIYSLRMFRSQLANKKFTANGLFINDVLLKFFFLGIPFQVLTLYSANAFRLALLFHISGIILLPNAINCLPDPNSRRLCYVIANIIFIVEFIFFTSGSSGVQPYIFYWETA